MIADRFTGKKPAKNDRPVPEGLELQGDSPQLPWDQSTPTVSAIPALERVHIFELDGHSVQEPVELESSGVEVLANRTVSDRESKPTELAEAVVASRAAETLDSLVQERAVLDEMKRDTEDDVLRRAP